MIGVDYELFWTLNPKSLAPFVKAFHLRQELTDAESWQLGAYVRMAITSSLGKNSKYPKEPLLSKNKKKKKVVDNSKTLRDNFLRHVASVNTRFE